MTPSRTQYWLTKNSSKVIWKIISAGTRFWKSKLSTGKRLLLSFIFSVKFSPLFLNARAMFLPLQLLSLFSTTAGLSSFLSRFLRLFYQKVNYGRKSFSPYVNFFHESLHSLSEHDHFWQFSSSKCCSGHDVEYSFDNCQKVEGSFRSISGKDTKKCFFFSKFSSQYLESSSDNSL